MTLAEQLMELINRQKVHVVVFFVDKSTNVRDGPFFLERGGVAQNIAHPPKKNNNNNAQPKREKNLNVGKTFMPGRITLPFAEFIAIWICMTSLCLSIS